MSSKVRGASKASPTAPYIAILQEAFAAELAFAAVELFMGFAVVTSGERFSANTANERPLVCMSA
jgi:hypothetical protein